MYPEQISLFYSDVMKFTLHGVLLSFVDLILARGITKKQIEEMKWNEIWYTDRGHFEGAQCTRTTSPVTLAHWRFLNIVFFIIVLDYSGCY